MTEQKVEPWWSATIVSEYEIARGDFAKDGKPKGYSICPTKSIKASANDCTPPSRPPGRSTNGSDQSTTSTCARAATGVTRMATAPPSKR